jgi:hypothetical protein
MMGKVLYSHDAIVFDEVPHITYNRFEKNRIEILDGIMEGKPINWQRNGYYELSDKPIGYDYNDGILPYKAEVWQDIARYYKITPKRYDDCNLMAEKHGGYYQFKCNKTGEVLRIALNSHNYKPI